MGTSHTVEQFCVKLGTAAERLDKARVQAVRKAGTAVKASIIANRDARGVRTLTIRGRSRPVTVTGPKITHMGPIVVGTVRGGKLWWLLEQPHKAYQIRPRRGRRGAQALAFGGGFYASANMPARAGRRLWTACVREAPAVATAVLYREMPKPIREIFA